MSTPATQLTNETLRQQKRDGETTRPELADGFMLRMKCILFQTKSGERIVKGLSPKIFEKPPLRKPLTLGIVAVIMLVLAPSPARAQPRCEVGEAVEGLEIHCFLSATDGLKQTITLNSAFPTEVLFEQTTWIGACGKPASHQTRVAQAFRGESKSLSIPVSFKLASECAEVAFTGCQAAEATGSSGNLKTQRFDCPAALQVIP